MSHTECICCKARAFDNASAAESGWVPSANFGPGCDEYGPFCPSCVESFLDVIDGDYEMNESLDICQKIAKATRRQNDKAIGNVFRGMNPRQAQEIREGHYKAAEGLQTLVSELEGNHLLADEYRIAFEALEVLRKSRLGAVL